MSEEVWSSSSRGVSPVLRGIGLPSSSSSSSASSSSPPSSALVSAAHTTVSPMGAVWWWWFVLWRFLRELAIRKAAARLPACLLPGPCTELQDRIAACLHT